MKPEGSSPCSQQHAIGLSSETDASSLHIPALFP
jgi:hypothetical protein